MITTVEGNTQLGRILFQLIKRPRPECVGTYNPNFVLFLDVVLSQFTYRRGFPRTLQPDHHNHI